MENITVSLNFGDQKSIKYLIDMSKETGQMFVSEFITLQKGKHYYLPTDCKLDLKNYTFFKINSELIDFIDVRNLNKGIITILPLVHNYQLMDKTVLGNLI